MKITLIPGQELGDDLVRAWIRLQQGNPDLASPYFHPKFTKAIAAVRNDVEVAVMESDGKIVAFFPFQRDERREIGRPVGGIISDYQGLICAQDFRFSPRELLESSRLVAWDFDHLVASQCSFAPFQWSIDPSPQIDISDGYDAYLQERRLEGKTKKKARRIEVEVGPLRFVAQSADATSLETMLAWKSAQYRRSVAPDLFAPGWIREAVGRILAMQEDGCAGMLSLLYAGDRLVAGHFGMRSQRTWHYWFPSYNPEVAEYSPGLILLLRMAKHAPAIGVSTIDLGKGMSPYKERLMNSRSLLASGRLETRWRSVPRRTYKVLRSRLGNSSLGPPAHAMIGHLRRLVGRWSAKQQARALGLIT